ncbi:MAG: hypothetical protein WCF95_04235 [bacterium]
MQKDTKLHFPWREEYFIARVLLGFSEEEFWQSTPRKIHTLKLLYDRFFGYCQGKKSNKAQAQEILTLLGH